MGTLGYEEYHPFGTTAWWATNGSTEVSRKRYRYTGKERDDETGLGYHGARYYAAWLGRWERPDPAGMVDGPNRYGYCLGNPILLNDPTGNAPLAPAGLDSVPRVSPYFAVDVQEVLVASGINVGPLADLANIPSRGIMPVPGQTSSANSLFAKTLGNDVVNRRATTPIQIGMESPSRPGKDASYGELGAVLAHEIVHTLLQTPALPSHPTAPDQFRRMSGPLVSSYGRSVTSTSVADNMGLTDKTFSGLARESAGFAAMRYVEAQVQALGSVESALDVYTRSAATTSPEDRLGRLVTSLRTAEASFQENLTRPFEGSGYGAPNQMIAIDPGLAKWVRSEFFGVGSQSSPFPSGTSILDVPGVARALADFEGPDLGVEAGEEPVWWQH